MEQFVTILQTLFMFAVVLFGCYWFTKKFAKTSIKASQSKYMKILDRMMLGQDKYLCIMEIGSRRFVISVTAGEIRVLSEISEEDLVEGDVAGARTPVSLEFKNILDRLKREKDTKL